MSKKGELESGKWIPVADTALAKQSGSRSAGYAFAKAGFAKRNLWDSSRKMAVACVEIQAAFLTADEVAKAKAVVKAEAKPSFKDLIKTVEQLNKVIDSLREENRQLRQHIAKQTNGLSDRARTALAAARQRLNLLDD